MTSVLPPLVAPSSLALRAVSRAGHNDWLLLVVAGAPLEGAIEQLVENLRAFNAQVSVSDARGRSVEEIVDSIGASPPGTVLVVHGLDALTDEEWRHIDLLRSRLIGAGTVVLVMSLVTAGRISRNAPNLASWIGGAMWTLAPDADSLSDAERKERLRALRRWSKLTDEEVVRRAADGSLPDDPEYTEWLILLDRADLVVS